MASKSDKSSDSKTSSTSMAQSTNTCVLVTVGTTRFDALIEALDSEAVSIISYLRKAGYTKLVLQIGTGSVEPLNLVKHATHDFAVEYFKFSHTFKDVIQTAGLVISHAGAGTILEVLRMPSPAPKLLVVVNTKLMDNHQLELAEALSQGSYLFHAEPHNVVETIRKSDWASIQPYPPIDSTAFPLLLAHEVSGS